MLESEVYIPLIKEIYTDKNYHEADILLRVPQGRGVPSVVEFAYAENITSGPKESFTRYRIAYCLANRSRLCALSKDVFVAPYGLLESESTEFGASKLC